MKVIAINSSPNMDIGNTALILKPFLEGMQEVGAEVELFYTKKLNINPCQGEFNCWYKTPGKCFQKDDMQMLLPKILKADVLVFATPLYCDGINGAMKNLWDRLIPLCLPNFELRNGHCRHPLRKEIKLVKAILVSNCGFWELDNFDPMINHMKAFCKNTQWEFVGALLRPHGHVLRAMMEMGLNVNVILDAAKEAGRQLMKDGSISIEILNSISRQLIPLEMFLQEVNKYTEKQIDTLKAK
ncbi:MAG: flavodoxin family protein [Candidatus Odinarchaeota archaeon]